MLVDKSLIGSNTPLSNKKVTISASRTSGHAPTLVGRGVGQCLTYETAAKDARINIRIPEPLLNAIKAKAAARGIPYQRLIRELLEAAV